MDRLIATLRRIVGGLKDMPNFRTHKWNDFTVKVRPSSQDFLRTLDLLHLFPYFWDTEIALDLLIQPPKGKLKIEEIWDYRWELCNLDNEILKSGRGMIDLNSKEIRKEYWAYSVRAIILGNLKPYQHYVLNVYLTSGEYGKSEALQVATYTIKDRDEYNIQLLILILGIGFAFLLWLLSRG